jgi:hypothetical protein
MPCSALLSLRYSEVLSPTIREEDGFKNHCNSKNSAKPLSDWNPSFLSLFPKSCELVPSPFSVQPNVEIEQLAHERYECGNDDAADQRVESFECDGV